jgi:hypothetical protein
VARSCRATLPSRLGVLQTLEPTYGAMCDDALESRVLFRALGVHMAPLWTQHVQVLQLLSGEKPSDTVSAMPDGERRRLACGIFAAIAKQFETGELSNTDVNLVDNWRAVLRTSALLPSEAGWFRSREVLLNDDESARRAAA